MSETFSPVMAPPVAEISVSARARFLIRTYAHLFGAIAAFVGIEVALFKTGGAATILNAIQGTSWMLVLGAFMVVGWLASSVAARARSMGAQYAALALFVVAEAVIFVPLLAYAFLYAPGAITSSALVTLVGFGGLTSVVYITRKDFSPWGGILRWIGVCAIILIAASLIFGFHLGTWFSVGMVAFAGGAILFDTSNVLHHYPEDRYVSAALQLFASVALLFWYVLQIFSRSE